MGQADLVEAAGTSYGVSLLYLLAAMRDNVAANGPHTAHPPKVWGTENEPRKVKIAYDHLRQGFEDRDEAKEMLDAGQVEILEGDIRQTAQASEIAEGSLDALLLDSKSHPRLPQLRPPSDPLHRQSGPHSLSLPSKP